MSLMLSPGSSLIAANECSCDLTARTLFIEFLIKLCCCVCYCWAIYAVACSVMLRLAFLLVVTLLLFYHVTYMSIYGSSHNIVRVELKQVNTKTIVKQNTILQLSRMFCFCILYK